MIRVKTFAFHEYSFHFPNEDLMRDSRREDHIEKYQNILFRRAKELEPMEDFITEIGRENIFKITTGGCNNYLVYSIFYKDGRPCRV